MSNIEYNVSLRGRKCLGRAEYSPDKVILYLNKLAQEANPETNLKGFIAELCATEFHEFGHIFGARGLCKSAKSCQTKCWWCRFTELLVFWFKNNKRWERGYSFCLKYASFEDYCKSLNKLPKSTSTKAEPN